MPSISQGRQAYIYWGIKPHPLGGDSLPMSRIHPSQAGYDLNLTQSLGKIAILGQPPRAMADMPKVGN
jgi:hypothetical protein